MQDELFIREWNEGHEKFAADLTQTLDELALKHWTRRAGAKPIGSPYDRILDRQPVEPSRGALSPAAQASLRGLLASVITVTLWVSVMLVATPAPGLAHTVLA